MIPFFLHELLSTKGMFLPSSFCVEDQYRAIGREEILSLASGVESVLAAYCIPGNFLLLSTHGNAGMVPVLSAASKLGLASVPVSPDASVAQSLEVISSLSPKAVFVDNDTNSLIQSAYERNIPVIKFDDIYAIEQTGLSVRTFSQTDIDVVLGMLTSGTSSAISKTVCMSHSAVISASESICRYLEIDIEDRVVMLPPPSFDYGLYQVFIAALRGATVVMPGNEQRKFPGPLGELIATKEITVLPLTPSQARIFVRSWRRSSQKFGSVRSVTFTGSPFPVEMIDDFGAVFPNAKIVPMYGITEAKRCTYLPSVHYPKTPLSVGVAIPNSRISIVNSEGNECSPLEHGEVRVEGRNVMSRYHGLPELTNKVTGGQFNVLLTGDIGFKDAEGLLHLVGRRDDIVKINDQRVSLKSLESVLLNIDLILQCAIVYSADKGIVAFVVSTGRIDTEHIARTLFDEFVTKAVVPKRIIEVSTLPLTDNGKTDYNSLKKIAFSDE